MIPGINAGDNPGCWRRGMMRFDNVWRTDRLRGPAGDCNRAWRACGREVRRRGLEKRRGVRSNLSECIMPG